MTKEKFNIYEEIRQSGETNMFDVKAIIELSGDELTKEDCLGIMKNYSKYEKEYN